MTNRNHLLVAVVLAWAGMASAFAPIGTTQLRRAPGQQTVDNSYGKPPAVTKVPISSLFAGRKAVAASQKNLLQRILPAIGSVFAGLAELSAVQKLLFVGCFLGGIWVGRIPPFWKSYRDVQEIPARMFGTDAPVLRGRAVSVSDGDTIRFYHTPLPWQEPPEKMKVSQVALPVRLCTMDTPETPKFGKPGQAFGLEAKATLKDFLGTGPITVRLLQKDQYGRAVAQVMKGGKHADEFMLKQGMAEVYLGGGAVYGPKGLEAYQELEKQAKKKKLGIWSTGKRESAAEYKKRTK